MSIHIEASLALGEKKIFSRMHLSLQPGKWVAILGGNGIGKSSFLRLLAGLIKPNNRLTKITTPPAFSQSIAYMSQKSPLLPWLNVLENATLNEKFGLSVKKERFLHNEQAKILLISMGLGEYLDYYPHQLSGGMYQKVALVRTLMQDKPVIFMDEPFSALDTLSRYHLQNLAVQFLKGKTVVFVTHDPLEALRLGHHIYIMKGKPATLTSFRQLSSRTPRLPTDEDVNSLHGELLQTLSYQQDL